MPNSTGRSACKATTTPKWNRTPRQDAGAQVAVLCSFERGTRAEDPDFGITDPTFTQVPINTSEIEQQAAHYIPQATVHAQSIPEAGGTATVTVSVSAVNPDDDEPDTT